MKAIEHVSCLAFLSTSEVCTRTADLARAPTYRFFRSNAERCDIDLFIRRHQHVMHGRPTRLRLSTQSKRLISALA